MKLGDDYYGSYNFTWGYHLGSLGVHSMPFGLF